MEIKYLKIFGLFGQYNHEIHLSDGVNIIIGDNGVGKTVCLKIINSIFSADFQYLFDLDFKSIDISFGGEIWTITKEPKSSRERNHINPGFFFYESESLKIESNLHGSHLLDYEDSMPDLPPFLVRVSDNEWLDRRRDIVYDEKELPARFGVRKIQREMPEWISRRFKGALVRLIDTQRIYSSENGGRRAVIGRTVSKYVKDISVVIREEQNKAGQIASQLDRSFPSRLVEDLSIQHDVSSTEVLERLFDVDKLTHSLHDVGLTEYSRDMILKNLQQIDEPTLRVLSLYSEDMKRKLEAYNEIHGKLQLFLDIINSRFENKRCVINSEKEFSFVTNSNGRNRQAKTIAPELLSSGEQNEFVLFYDLIFNCPARSFILIDEPELSLHIKWQQMMIGDMVRVCEHNRLNVLIATHSPDLIGNHWSLVQKLG